MGSPTDTTEVATDRQARRIVTAVALYLLADAMRARLPGPRPLSDADLARSLEFALIETQVRAGIRLPTMVC